MAYSRLNLPKHIGKFRIGIDLSKKTEKELHEIAGIFVFNGFSARCVTGANEDIYNDFKTMANTETGSLLLCRIYASNHDMLNKIDFWWR